MPTDFAAQLADQLCAFLAIPVSDRERAEIAASIDYHARHLGKSNRDDLAPLLFIECGKEAKHARLTPRDIRKLLSRVQKRIYRAVRRPQLDPTAIETARGRGSGVSPEIVDRVVAQFKTFLETKLSLRDSVIFQARYMDRSTIEDICRQLRLKKSTVYERLAKIRDEFRVFLDDVGIPDLHQGRD